MLYHHGGNMVFILPLAVAVLYLLRYHVWKTGPDPKQEYDQEMKVAAAQFEAFRKIAGETVDEKTVTMADAAGIAEGDKIFIPIVLPAMAPKVKVVWVRT